VSVQKNERGPMAERICEKGIGFELEVKE